MTKLNNRSKINKPKIRVGRGIGSGKGKTDYQREVLIQFLKIK